MVVDSAEIAAVTAISAQTDQSTTPTQQPLQHRDCERYRQEPYSEGRDSESDQRKQPPVDALPGSEAAARREEHHSENELDGVAHAGLFAAGVSWRLATARDVGRAQQFDGDVHPERHRDPANKWQRRRSTEVVRRRIEGHQCATDHPYRREQNPNQPTSHEISMSGDVERAARRAATPAYAPTFGQPPVKVDNEFAGSLV
jgi:hypothetical protein